MAVFPNTQIAIQPPKYWGQNMPDPTSPDWQSYQDWEATQPWMQPAGQAPSTFTGPDGGQWSAAGSQRMADMTTGDYYANMFNNRLQQAGRDPNGPDAKMFLLAMNSRQQVRPEEFQNAYMAHDDTGNAKLAEPLVSLFERLGVRPVGYDPGDAAGTTGTAPGGTTGTGGDPLNGAPVRDDSKGVDVTYKQWQDDHGFWHDTQHPGLIYVGGGWVYDPYSPRAGGSVPDEKVKPVTTQPIENDDGTGLHGLSYTPAATPPSFAEMGAAFNADKFRQFLDLMKNQRRPQIPNMPMPQPQGYGF